jgi:hypothetical protein
MVANSSSFSFQKDKQPVVGLENFWPPEDGFVWSTGSWCEIRLPPTINGGTGSEGLDEIAIDVDIFRAPPELEGQNVFIYVNGLRLASRFITGRMVLLLKVPAGALTSAENVISIDTPDATRPSAHGQGDSRCLGVKIFSVQIG